METSQRIATSATQPSARPSVKYLPVGLFGAVMSVAGLSLAWRLAHRIYGADIFWSNAIGVVALLTFSVLTLSYLAKLVRYPELVKQEFLHPITGNFFGTVGISILLLSSVISGYSTTAQLLVWTVGSAVTVILSAIMISRLMNGNASPASVVPAWLIAGVGTLDIVVTGGTFTSRWTNEINLLAAAIGGVSAIVFFVLIFSRLIHHEPLAAGMRPSKMILVAPFPVGFIAYVNLMHKVDMFAALLFYFGMFLFVIIAYRLLAKPAQFSASWWAIGFPIAALSNAALIYSHAVGGVGLGVIAMFMLFIVTTAIVVLAVRTIHALFTGRLLTV
jgi:tellurite resistance protein